MTTHAALTWSEPSPVGFHSISAENADGKWRIAPRPRDVANITFQPNHPDGLEGADAWQAYTQHPDYKSDQRGEEIQRLGHIFGMGCDDIGFCESVTEAQMLCAALAAGDEGIATVDEQLTAAGFTNRELGDKGCILWSKDIGSALYQIRVQDVPGDRSIWTTYQARGSNSWHNVVGLTAESTHDHRDGSIHTSFNTWPAASKDPLRVAVAHSIAVMDERLARKKAGGKGTAHPLGDPLPRK